MYEEYSIEEFSIYDLTEDDYDDEADMPEYCAGIMDTYDLEEEVMENELPIVMREVIGTLTPREQLVIFLHYGFMTVKPVTLKDIGSILGIRADHVAQIRNKALRKLRHPSRSRQICSWVWE